MSPLSSSPRAVTSAFPLAPRPSPRGVQTFRALFRQRFGRDLSMGEAEDLAARYLLLYSLGAQTKLSSQTNFAASSILPSPSQTPS